MAELEMQQEIIEKENPMISTLSVFDFLLLSLPLFFREHTKP